MLNGTTDWTRQMRSCAQIIRAEMGEEMWSRRRSKSREKSRRLGGGGGEFVGGDMQLEEYEQEEGIEKQVANWLEKLRAASEQFIPWLCPGDMIRFIPMPSCCCCCCCCWLVDGLAIALPANTGDTKLHMAASTQASSISCNEKLYFSNFLNPETARSFLLVWRRQCLCVCVMTKQSFHLPLSF